MRVMFRIAPWLVMAVGLLFIGLGVLDIRETMSFNAGARTIEGEVIRVATESHYDTKTKTTSHYYVPTFSFAAPGGETREAPSTVGSSFYDFEIGTKMAILYNPAYPDEVRIDGFVGLYLFPIVYTFFGLLAIGLGWMAFRFMR